MGDLREIDGFGARGQLDTAPLRLAARDAANIYFETERAPANIVDAYVFNPLAGPLDPDAVIEWLRARLESVPIVRRRLHRTWADLDYPAWVVDETPDFRAHITVVAGEDWTGTKAIIAERIGSTMDLTRPPWDITVVTGVDRIGDGVPDGATVAVLRFHHSIGDAVATAAIGRKLFGASVEEEVRSVGRTTSLPGLLGVALRTSVRLVEYAGALGSAAFSGRRIRGAEERGDLAATASEPPATRFNSRMQGVPAIGLVHFDLAVVRAVSTAAGVTVNDVMLSVVAGGLTDLLVELGERPNGSLVASMPIAVNDKVITANRFALGMVDLCTDVVDPAVRLGQIHDQTSAEKARHAHPLLERKRAIAESIPAFVTRLASDAARRQGAAPSHDVSATTMISNVPGKAEGAKFMGAEIVDRFGVLTLSDGAALAHFISSVGPTVSLAFSADSELLPSCGRYEELLRGAFDSILASS